ncbi:MAG TPA: transposase [Thermoanaerobaculia bacterium]|nr:transposase [Dermatophilaceae bacterium]HRS37523.1 transposase [Thermoanaerobaculia bacterium]
MSGSTVEAVASSPDPEVRPERRSYPASYKLKILAELDAADSKSERGEVMRREGLYSSLISAWRDQRDAGALEAMKAKRPGPKVDAVKAENARLRAQVAALEEQLSTAEELIDAQGKASALLQQMRRKSAGPTS